MKFPRLLAAALLVATSATGAGKTLPTAQTGISVSRKDVLITAFGQNPDGFDTLLRLWEQAGQSGDLTITVTVPYASATPVNLRGEPMGGPLKITDGKLTFPLKAYAPASFILK